jgi:hypothetical protein
MFGFFSKKSQKNSALGETLSLHSAEADQRLPRSAVVRASVKEGAAAGEITPEFDTEFSCGVNTEIVDLDLGDGRTEQHTQRSPFDIPQILAEEPEDTATRPQEEESAVLVATPGGRELIREENKEQENRRERKGTDRMQRREPEATTYVLQPQLGQIDDVIMCLPQRNQPNLFADGKIYQDRSAECNIARYTAPNATFYCLGSCCSHVPVRRFFAHGLLAVHWGYKAQADLKLQEPQ